MKKTDPPQQSIMPDFYPAISGRGALLLTKTSLLMLAFVMVFHDAFAFLVQTWTARDDYSFGFLVPVVSALMIHADRERIRAIAIRPSIFWGIAWMTGASLLFLLGRVSGGVMAQEFSVPLLVPGIVLTLFGSAMLRRLAFPLAYLFLMAPIFDFFIMKLQYAFQIMSATMSAGLLQALQIDVLRRDQYLHLPKIILEVAPACSGLHYLVSIFAIALPLAFFTQKTWTRKAGLIAAAFIIGIAANILRITLIGVWTVVSGTGPVHGPLHVFQGLFVSVIGFAGLFLTAFGLSQVPYSERVKRKSRSLGPLPPAVLAPSEFRRFQAAWIVSLLLLCAVGMMGLFPVQTVPLHAPLEELPAVIGTWKGTDVLREEVPFGLGGADEALFREYKNADGERVQFFIGYFASQDENKKIVHYRSEISMPGGDYERIGVGSDFIPVNKKIVKQQKRYYAVLSFYQVNGRALAGPYAAKIRFAYEGLFHRRTNGAIVAVWREITGPNAEQAFRECALFLAEAYPFIHSNLR